MRHLAIAPAYRSRGFVIFSLIFGLIAAAFIGCFSLFIPSYRHGGCLVKIFFGLGGVAGFIAAAFVLAAGAGYLNTQNDDWMVWGCVAGIPLGGIAGAEFADAIRKTFVNR